MFEIDEKKCIQCGDCAKVCLCGFVTAEEDRVFFDREKQELCIRCGHCRSICKEKAITIDIEEDHSVYEKCHDCFSEDILAMLKGKRSVRTYIDKQVEESMIEEGIRFAQYAPSASNLHPAEWIVVSGRNKTDQILHLIMDYFKRSNKFPVVEALQAAGKNVVTLNAPCMIFTCVMEKITNQAAADCALAMGYADIYWYKHGLGSCWSGFCIDAANHDGILRQYLGISENSKVYGAMALGYPDEPAYSFLPQRKTPHISWIQAAE